MEFTPIALKFLEVEAPKYRRVGAKPYIPLGLSDDWAEKLLKFRKESPKHNAIINGKVKYIFGGGIEMEQPNPVGEVWISSCNSRGESLSDVLRKSIDDTETFGGFYWHVITDRIGRITDVFHMEWPKMRRAADLQKFFFKYDWKDGREKPKEFPAFNPRSNEAQSAIYYFDEYRPGCPYYPEPGYMGALNWIGADCEMGKHTYTNSKAGFSASKMLSFFNGEPDERAKRKLEERLHDKYTGADGKKIFISFNNDPAKKPEILDLGASDLTKEDFSAVNNLICDNIYAGHEITSPILFGVKEAGQLGGTTELRNAFEIFNNTYVANKRAQFEEVLNKFAKLKGIPCKFKLKPVEPIGYDLSGQLGAMPVEWIAEKLGVDLEKYPLAPGAPESMANEVNDHLKNLTGRQRANMDRIIRKFNKGEYTRQRAAWELKTSLGLSDEDINTILGTPQEFKEVLSEDQIAQLFAEHGTDGEGWEVLRSETFSTDNEYDIDMMEMAMRLSFAEEQEGVVSGESPTRGTQPTRETPPTRTIKLPDVKVMYSYEKGPGVEGPAILPTTRPFCRKMVTLNRLYTRKDIETISERVGYSVWNRRGGFWNQGNGVITPYCRHVWKMNLVVKKTS
jgi:hypothetical protein